MVACISFEELCQLEPRLEALRREAESADADRSALFCARSAWLDWEEGGYCGFKWRLASLVGPRAGEPESECLPGGPVCWRWLGELLPAVLEETVSGRGTAGRVDERLRTGEAYEVASEAIRATLPSCRGCACVPEEEVAR